MCEPLEPSLASHGLGRRQFLRHLGLGAGGLVLGAALPWRALAQSGAPPVTRRFVFAYFEGGWDILLGLDPRNPLTTNPTTHGIDPAYGRLQGAYALRGVQRAANLSFGPAVPPAMLAHAGDVSIINGIAMDTAAHEVGRRYFITGRFPRGNAAVGSSAPSEIVAQVGETTPIPYISAGVEAYATGLPPYAAALNINSAVDLAVALTPFADFDPDVLAAVQSYQDRSPNCEAQRLDRDGLTTRLRDSQARARDYIERDLDAVFDYSRPEAASLRALYGLDGAAADSPAVLAFLSGQALKAGISQCVSVTLARGLDTHSNWAQDQAPRQEQGWAALAALISDLKATPLPGDARRSFLDDTTILAFSEFARQPTFNNVNGRDHFLGNSCLVAGAGVRRGVTIGASAEVGMMPLETELATGLPVVEPTDGQKESGAVQVLTPKHVLTTILESASLDASFLRSESIGALRA